MTDRAPWLPSDEAIIRILLTAEFSADSVFAARRLIEISGLKAQIEALDYISAALTSSESFERVAEVRARILSRHAALEAEYE